MRDIVIANNIMSDVNQGLRLTCNDMNNFYIHDNILLMNDGYDIASVRSGLVTTVINHSLVADNKIKFHKVSVTAGKGLAADAAFITSVPAPNQFTYALTPKGETETSDTGAGGRRFERDLPRQLSSRRQFTAAARRPWQGHRERPAGPAFRGRAERDADADQRANPHRRRLEPADDAPGQPVRPGGPFPASRETR